MALVSQIVPSLTGLLAFGWFAWAVRYHFASSIMPVGMRIVSVVSLLAIAAFIHEIWTAGALAAGATAVGIGLHVGALALFLWSVRASRKARLALAFDRDEQLCIVREGPFGWVRHPFYLSYVMFWTGCAFAAQSAVCAVFALILGCTYLVAALREERLFRASSLAVEYQAYATTAGLFWPKDGVAAARRARAKRDGLPQSPV
jgi:protein-S-isoprenylcysteine O-methyltransferase Ste14